MLFLKIAVALSFIWVGFALYRARAYARRRFESSLAIKGHRFWAWTALWSTLGAVLLTEGMVRLAGLQPTPLFWVHLSIAFTFLLILLALPWMNGFRIPSWHKQLGYTCIIAYVGTFTTGSVLLYNL